MCNVRTTTAITFIFRINTLSFPLRRHISPRGGGRLYFVFPKLKLSKFRLSFTPDFAPTSCLEITPRLSLGSASPLRLRREAGGLWAERPSAVRYEQEDEESRSRPVPVCHRLAPLPRSLSAGSIRLAPAAGVWPPQSIFSAPGCLQLVGSDRRPLIFLHGVRVRHESFSYSRALELHGTLEKHFQRTSSLSAALRT